MKRILLVLVVVVLVVLGSAWFYLDRIAQAAVERGGTRALGVAVRVDSMALSPLSGRLGMDGFRVANPGGFSDQPAFQLGSGQVGVRLGSLFEDVIDIPEIRLDGLRVRLERNERGINLERLLANLDGGGGGTGGDAGAQAGGAPVRVLVRHLRIAGAGADVDLGPGFGERGRFELELPTIELRDIGAGGEGVTVEQLIERVTRAVISRIEEAGARQLPDRIRRELRQRLDHERQAIESEVEQELGKEKKKLRDKAGDELQKLIE